MEFKPLTKTKMLKNKDFSCFQTLYVVFIMLINVKMSTIVGIVTLMSMQNNKLGWVEHEKSFITSGLLCKVISLKQKRVSMTRKFHNYRLQNIPCQCQKGTLPATKRKIPKIKSTIKKKKPALMIAKQRPKHIPSHIMRAAKTMNQQQQQRQQHNFSCCSHLGA